jgi:hypothetical protein
MGATPKNFKTIGKDEGPPPQNSMECEKIDPGMGKKHTICIALPQRWKKGV